MLHQWSGFSGKLFFFRFSLLVFNVQNLYGLLVFYDVFCLRNTIELLKTVVHILCTYIANAMGTRDPSTIRQETPRHFISRRSSRWFGRGPWWRKHLLIVISVLLKDIFVGFLLGTWLCVGELLALLRSIAMFWDIVQTLMFTFVRTKWSNSFTSLRIAE